MSHDHCGCDTADIVRAGFAGQALANDCAIHGAPSAVPRHPLIDALPDVTETGEIDLASLRHPLVEAIGHAIGSGAYRPPPSIGSPQTSGPTPPPLNAHPSEFPALAGFESTDTPN